MEHTLHYDEFSIYTTRDEIFEFIENLLENGISNELEIYDLCIEEFGKYFTQHIESLNK
jgi:hypothetical protein